MTTQQIPKSKAKTAYGVLSEICALADGEPKRITMALYLDYGEPGEDYPACGTIGCIAGWTTVLKPRYRKRRIRTCRGNQSENEGQVAQRILGLSELQALELFRDETLMRAPEQQTKKHARDVVAHVRRFQKANRAQLLAKKV